MTPKSRKVMIQNAYDFLHFRQVKAFYVMVDSCSFDAGAHAILQGSGVGKLSPNMLLLGYKENWLSCPREEVHQYFTVLQ